MVIPESPFRHLRNELRTKWSRLGNFSHRIALVYYFKNTSRIPHRTGVLG